MFSIFPNTVFYCNDDMLHWDDEKKEWFDSYNQEWVDLTHTPEVQQPRVCGPNILTVIWGAGDLPDTTMVILVCPQAYTEIAGVPVVASIWRWAAQSNNTDTLDQVRIRTLSGILARHIVFSESRERLGFLYQAVTFEQCTALTMHQAMRNPDSYGLLLTGNYITVAYRMLY